jgi:hypothetical protein
MTRLRLIALNLFTGTAVLLAQDPQTGGWRRFGEPLPAPAPQAQPAQQAQQDKTVILDQDPSQPVARNDAPVYTEQAQQAQPGLQQRPPAAVPHYGLPNAVAIKPGTFITIRTEQGLSSDHNQAGDYFSASLAQPIVVDGIVVALPGQHVIGRVADAKKAGRVEGTSRLALQLTGLTLVDGTQANIQSQMMQRNGQTSVGTDAAAVATTTGMGAAIGAAADWGRGAAIGAGAGAAAGLVGVLLTRGRPTVVYPESLLTFRLDSQVIVDLTRAPQAFRYIGPDDFERPVQTTVARRPVGPGPGGPAYGPSPYGYPAYYSPYGWGYPYAFGPTFGVGVVVRGGGWGWGRPGWGWRR